MVILRQLHEYLNILKEIRGRTVKIESPDRYAAVITANPRIYSFTDNSVHTGKLDYVYDSVRSFPLQVDRFVYTINHMSHSAHLGMVGSAAI